MLTVLCLTLHSGFANSGFLDLDRESETKKSLKLRAKGFQSTKIYDYVDIEEIILGIKLESLFNGSNFISRELLTGQI